MYLSVSPLWIISNNYEDWVFQVFIVHIHGLQEVLLLQVFCPIQLLIFQVISSPNVNTHKLTRFCQDFLGFSLLIHLCGVISQYFFKALVYPRNKSLPEK